MLWRWLAEDFTLSKRGLGILLAVAGIVGIIGVIVFDALTGGDQFGPAQQLALGGAGLALAVGLSLIPLGDEPA
jgi:hypothetical protein